MKPNKTEKKTKKKRLNEDLKLATSEPKLRPPTSLAPRASPKALGC